ncbi:MAG: universal stress protein [Pseudomonadota bacterium]
MREIKKVLVPVDFSEHSGKIMDYAMDMAERLEAKVYIIHVVGRLQDLPDFYFHQMPMVELEAEIAKSAERTMKDLVEKYLNRSTEFETRVTVGDISSKIDEMVKAESIDLIIMGTHGRKGLDRMLFGSVAEQVVKTASCPVMTVNPYKL